MTIFRNFINQGVTNYSRIKILRYFRFRPSALTSKMQQQKWINEKSK